MAKLLITGTLILATTAIVGWLSLQDQSKIAQLEKSPDRGKMSWHAELAKAKGHREVLLRSSMVSYAMPKSLDEALAYYHVVIAESVESRSFATTYDVLTWYKFRIIEELSRPLTECTTCPAVGTPPIELLPIKPDEFLASKIGGEAVVDGIKITSLDPVFPRFEKSKRYLLFILLDSQKMVGALQTGPWGSFVLTPNETLEPVDKDLKHPLRRQLAEELGDSIPNLRMRLKKQK